MTLRADVPALAGHHVAQKGEEGNECSETLCVGKVFAGGARDLVESARRPANLTSPLLRPPDVAAGKSLTE